MEKKNHDFWSCTSYSLAVPPWADYLTSLKLNSPHLHCGEKNSICTLQAIAVGVKWGRTWTTIVRVLDTRYMLATAMLLLWFINGTSC
jgi:hypothetical protein